MNAVPRKAIELASTKRIAAAVILVAAIPVASIADEVSLERIEHSFRATIGPIIDNHCLSCHDSDTREAELDLSHFRSASDVSKSHPLWAIVLERVESGEMPPKDAPTELDDADRTRLVGWIRNLRQFDARRNAGDPGPVLVRRLSNAEFDYSIRDLTGIDIQPTRTFPIDPANEAGFDNSGESLMMSPGLMKKYLQAARHVAEHLVLTPTGIDFAPYPVATDTDRDKYCVKRIVSFYERQPTDLADYFFAAWRYRRRTSLGDPTATLQQIAVRQNVSPKYLNIVWDALTNTPVELGPLADVQQMWRALPKSGDTESGDTQSGDTQSGDMDQVKTQCIAIRDYVRAARKVFEPRFENLHIDGVHKGSQSFVLWKNRQYAAYRRRPDFSFLDQAINQPVQGDDEGGRKRGDQAKKNHDKRSDSSRYPFGLPDAETRDAFESACQTFCSVFPDAFYISERGRDYLGKPREQQEKGRLLSAGFHSMMGYFRDDQPLYDLVLDPGGQRELDQLWKELDFVTSAPQRQYQGFLWFERTDSGFMRDPEFDFARPENQESLRATMIDKLAERYLAKAARNGGDEVPLQAIADFFVQINEQIQWVESARAVTQPYHVDAMIEIAQRAHRRILSSDETGQLRDYYRQLRDQHQLSHEEAMQDMLVAILMSPHFCYRIDLLSDSQQPRALNDFELASRLSYFLWSSLPDSELIELASAGTLREPGQLIAQVHRMMKDDRIRGLATEFAGNWLDFRRFQQHNSVDRGRFPQFNDDLREAMYEEPIRFFVDVVRHDRSVLDFLYSKRTFVNAALAEHYEMTDIAIGGRQWTEVADASRYGRGGLLPMSVFLTKNSPGLRTSPVKRGYWVVRRLLGERIPAPPPNVPELPADESQLGDLTLREALARHREHTSCAGCHDRFDAFGIVFEGYDPIGQRRQHDLGGRPVDTLAEFPDGSRRQGVEELRSYINQQRGDEFVDNLCRKLLSYALGRSLQLSDESLLATMRRGLQQNDYRFAAMVETIVTSPQFLSKRGRDGALTGESRTDEP